MFENYEEKQKELDKIKLELANTLSYIGKLNY